MVWLYAEDPPVVSRPRFIAKSRIYVLTIVAVALGLASILVAVATS